ncbi:MAG: sulfatase [Gemmatimonadota bacterium]
MSPNTDGKGTGGIAQSIVVIASWAVLASLMFVAEVGWKVFVSHDFVAAPRDVAWMAPLGALISFIVILTPPLALAGLLVRGRIEITRIATFLAVALVTFSVLLPWTQIGRLAALVLALGLGSAAARYFTTDTRLRTLYRTAAAALVVQLASATVIGLLAARSTAAARAALGPAPEGTRPNVLILLLDTVRGDGMSLYGYRHNTTPRIDAFAASGMVFESAISTAPWTLPAHGTLFTGRYPGELSTSFTAGLDRRFPTIAEVFANAGYESTGFTGNLHYTAWDSGLARGFVTWHDFPRTLEQVVRSFWIGRSGVARELMAARQKWQVREALQLSKFMVVPKPGGDERDAEELTDAFLGWLRSRETQRPWFAFINYFDAHDSYSPPADLRLRFAADTANPTTRELYDAEVLRVDRGVGRLLDSLAATGRLTNTIVAITADHGEHFGERGMDGHGNSLYAENVHVPLIIRYDGVVPAGRLGAPVSLRDLPTTLIQLAGVATPFPGISIAKRWTTSDRDSLAGSLAVSELTQDAMPPDPDVIRRSQQVSLVAGGHHLIIRNRRNRSELYAWPSAGDTLPDLLNRAGGETTAARMRAELRSAMSGAGEPRPAIDSGTTRRNP